MTFTTSLKEEMSKADFSIVDAEYELISFLNCLGKFNKEVYGDFVVVYVN